MAMRRIGSKLSGVLLAAAHDAAFADGATGLTVTPSETARPDPADAVYDETQPGADDPRVKEGFAAYQAGDFKKAYDIWLPLAEAGNAEAQFRVGRLYHDGEGLAVSGSMAVYWYEKARMSSHATAQFNLATLYDFGRIVPQDYHQAYSLYESLAKRNHVKAQHNLGILYSAGRGVTKDVPLGLMWLMMASKSNFTSRKLLQDLREHIPDEDFSVAEKMLRDWKNDRPRNN